MEENQVAAPQGTEATSTNSNEQSTPAPAPAPEAPAAPAAPTADIPADKIEAFNKFVNANGGFEKAFAKLKADVSTQASEQSTQPQPQPQPQEAVPQPHMPEQLPKGYMSFQESAIEGYFEKLAAKKEYAPIADKILNGDVLKELAKFNIPVSNDRGINDGQIREFLNMYAKTVPTPVPSTPLTNTPTVDYVKVGEQITSRDEALKILQQNMDLGKRGIAEHPQTAAAKEYLKQYFNKK